LRRASWFIDDHLVPEREDLFAYYAGQDERQRLSGFATTASKESEALVHFMLAIGVAQSTQDAHGLVAGPDRPAWGRVAVEKASSASYSVDLTQARKSSRSRSSCPQHAPGPAVCTCVTAESVRRMDEPSGSAASRAIALSHPVRRRACGAVGTWCLELAGGLWVLSRSIPLSPAITYRARRQCGCSASNSAGASLKRCDAAAALPRKFPGAGASDGLPR
jgi:hypothetical protein